MPDVLKPAKHGRDHCPGGEDPIPCLGGLPFATAYTAVQTISDNVNDYNIVDLSVATFKSNDSRLDLINDVGHSPDYGITVPGGFTAQVMTTAQIESFNADGAHYVSWIVSGAFTISQFGPGRSGVTHQGAFSRDGLADDLTRPDTLMHIAHMGDSEDFVVGIIHTWDSWTNSPKNFRYGITVTLIGDLAT